MTRQQWADAGAPETSMASDPYCEDGVDSWWCWVDDLDLAMKIYEGLREVIPALESECSW